MTGLLNSRQEAFCRHFCATGNAAASARKAGYSVNSARQMGHELLEKPWIVERVREIRAGWRASARAHAAVMLARLEQAWDSAVAANDGRGSPCHMLQVIRMQAEITGLLAKGAGNRADLWDVAGDVTGDAAGNKQGATIDESMAPDSASDGALDADSYGRDVDRASPDAEGQPRRPSGHPLQAALRHGRHRAERALALRRSLARARANTGARTSRDAGGFDPVRELAGQLTLTGEIENRRRLAASWDSVRVSSGQTSALVDPDDSLTKPDIFAPTLAAPVSSGDNAEIDAAEVGVALGAGR